MKTWHGFTLLLVVATVILRLHYILLPFMVLIALREIGPRIAYLIDAFLSGMLRGLWRR
jgi:hypothetical protein